MLRSKVDTSPCKLNDHYLLVNATRMHNGKDRTVIDYNIMAWIKGMISTRLVIYEVDTTKLEQWAGPFVVAPPPSNSRVL